MRVSEAKKYLPIVAAMAAGQKVEWRWSYQPDGPWYFCDPGESIEWFGREDENRVFRIDGMLVG